VTISNEYHSQTLKIK